MPLRQKLFFIIGIMTLVPLLILQFGVVSQIEADLQKRITAELHEKLSNMAAELGTLVENQKDLAAGLAEVPILKDFSTTSVANEDTYYHDRVRDLQEYFVNFQRKVRTIQAMRFVDKTGKTLVKVKEGRRIEPELLDKDRGRYYVADQSSRPFFKNALDDQIGVYVSNFELGRVQVNADFCPSMVRYSVPIRDDLTDLEGLLIINMWGTRIDETVMSAMSGFNGKAYVVEVNNQNKARDGIYLFHEDNNQRFANQLDTDFRFKSDLGSDNWNTIRDKDKPGYMLLDDGRMYFYLSYSPYEDDRASWMLVIETAYDTVFAPIEKLRNTIWLLVGVLLLLSLLIARWVADRLATPVQELAETIKHYADGDETARYLDGGRSDEVGIVGRAFNYLCGSLERTRQQRDKAEQAVRQSDRLAAVGQMAAGIGHEINNPLMNIMSLARLVEDSIGEHDKSELIKADLHTLQEEGERCARIVQGILKFARVSEPRHEEFMLDALLEDTVDLLRHRADSGSVKIVMKLEKGLSIQGDANQLQQVLVNILLNAIYASAEGGNINLALFTDNNYAVIEVTDEGTGISKKDMSDIFNPFFSTKPEGEGTGLGLSVSYGIIKKHDGEITLESKEGKGTCVKIRLPFGMDVAMKNKSKKVLEGV